MTVTLTHIAMTPMDILTVCARMDLLEMAGSAKVKNIMIEL